MVLRHFAWFTVDTGAWIGEWAGRLPTPVVPPALSGEARRLLLETWQHQAQSAITPAGAPYPTAAAVWDLDAWDTCPSGGAVCLDVTLYGWPVGDFRWAIFDSVDRLLDFRDQRTYVQVTPARAALDVVARSARPIRSTPEKLVIDLTGTSLEPLAGDLFGPLVRRDGRLLLLPSAALPEAVRVTLCQENPDLTRLDALDPEEISNG